MDGQANKDNIGGVEDVIKPSENGASSLDVAAKMDVVTLLPAYDLIAHDAAWNMEDKRYAGAVDTDKDLAWEKTCFFDGRYDPDQFNDNDLPQMDAALTYHCTKNFRLKK